MAKYLDEKWWMHPQIVNGKACPEGFGRMRWQRVTVDWSFCSGEGGKTIWRAQLVTVGGCAIGSDMNGECLGLIRLGS